MTPTEFKSYSQGTLAGIQALDLLSNWGAQKATFKNKAIDMKNSAYTTKANAKQQIDMMNRANKYNQLATNASMGYAGLNTESDYDSKIASYASILSNKDATEDEKAAAARDKSRLTDMKARVYGANGDLKSASSSDYGFDKIRTDFKEKYSGLF